MSGALAAPVDHPKTAIEALEQVDRWTRQLAGQWARLAGVDTQDLHHELQVGIFLRFGNWDRQKGSLTHWCAWQARAAALRLRRERRGPPRMFAASQGGGLAHGLETASQRLRGGSADESEPCLSHDEIEKLLAALRPRVAQAVRLRFGLDGTGRERTFDEVGQQMKISWQGARDLVVRGLEQLARRLSDRVIVTDNR